MQARDMSRGGYFAPQEIKSEIRPWGGWSLLNEGAGYKVKLIAISPGHRLSLQYHNHRSEQWVVIAGRARIVIGDETHELGMLQSARIPRGAIHRIENPYQETLIVVEMQEGETLAEDDIVRLEDDYQRAQLIRRIAR